MAHGPVNHTGYNRTGPPEQRNLSQTEKLHFLCWLAFVIGGSTDTQHSEWNYGAFIKQTAGPLRNLKAAAKQPTRKITYQNIAVFLYDRQSYGDVLGCYAATKTKQIDQSVKHRIQLDGGYLISILSLIRA